MEKPTTSKFRNKLFKLLPNFIQNLNNKKNKKPDCGVAGMAAKSSNPNLPTTKAAVPGGQMAKNSSFGEPISPKISCIGQIRHKKKMAKNIHLFLHQEICPAMASRNKGSLMKATFFLPEEQKIPSNMRNIHINNNGVSKQKGGRKSRCIFSRKGHCLDQMNRFESCRVGQISDFDWKIARFKGDDYRDEYTCNVSYSKEEAEIPFSALIGVTGRDGDLLDLEPRKEVNLWRRRTIDQPTPLQIRSPCPSLVVLRSRCE